MDRKCQVCGKILQKHDAIGGKSWCINAACEIYHVALPDETHADLLSARVAELEKEQSWIKSFCDNMAEFNEPMHPDCDLPELAERVFGEIADIYEERDSLAAENARLRTGHQYLIEEISALRKEIQDRTNAEKGADDGND